MILFLQEQQWSDRVPKFTATGGTKTTPGNGYAYHFLTANPHTFVIAFNDLGTNVEYVVVGGGGAGHQYPTTANTGGGGAGVSAPVVGKGGSGIVILKYVV